MLLALDSHDVVCVCKGKCCGLISVVWPLFISCFLGGEKEKKWKTLQFLSYSSFFFKNVALFKKKSCLRSVRGEKQNAVAQFHYCSWFGKPKGFLLLFFFLRKG